MRDVIRVERRAETNDPDAPGSVPGDGAWAAHAIDRDSLAALGRVADEVLPSLVARLAVSSLGELEVRHGDWHVRVRRGHIDGRAHATAAAPAEGGPASETTTASAAAAPAHSPDIATAPAVGYFASRAELAVGTRVSQGDVLGWIEVLGVRQELVAPVDGLVGKLLVGPGDPVEYGQELVQLVPGGARHDRPGHEGTEA
jgi:biotin carboxyl carrier protein